ncbi:MAG: ComF family protein [Aliidongia sp.]
MAGLRSAAAPFARLGRGLLDLVLPPRCILCQGRVDAPGTLCAPCWRGISFLGEPCCSCCGLPFPYEAGPGEILCAGCLAHRPRFDRARSVFVYDDHSRGLVLALKHGDRLQSVPAFGQWLARAGAALLAEADLIVPVPLHWTRLWRRRYNQSALLAQAACAAWRRQGRPGPVVMPDLLLRRRRTPSQGRRTRIQRAENVRGAFRLKRGADIQGRRVLLIDDVLTSGATVEECARVLHRAGAARVDVLTLARAVRVE